MRAQGRLNLKNQNQTFFFFGGGGGQSKNIYPESDRGEREIKVVAGHPAGPVFKLKGTDLVAWADGGTHVLAAA